MKFSQKSLERLKGLHPDMIKVAMRAIQITSIDFGISQGVRTVEQQAALYAQGRNGNPGPIVTWTMESKHLVQADGYGHAFDVVAYVDGKVSWKEEYYDKIAKAVLTAARELNVKIKWGGEWKTPDRPHFQLA